MLWINGHACAAEPQNIYCIRENSPLSTAERSQAFKVYGESPLYGEAAVEKATNYSKEDQFLFILLTI